MPSTPTPNTVDRDRPRTGDPVAAHLDIDPATGLLPRILASYGAGPWHAYDRLAPWNALSGLAEPVTTLCGQQGAATALDAPRAAGEGSCPRCVELVGSR